MKKIFLDEFYFFNIKYSRYHHTDQSNGSPVHYLAYMIKGTAKIVSHYKTIYINPGDVFYIPKNLPYRSYWFGDDSIEFLSFGFSNLQIRESINAELQIIPCNDKTVRKIQALPTIGTNIDLKTLSLFYDVMDSIAFLMKRSGQKNEELILEKIKDFIRNNPNSSVSHIAHCCAVSEPYIYLLFKKIMHTTPNIYKQKLLCEKAVELLVTTDRKVEEISSILQFSSASYFRKVLKKHTGKTPREIRKNVGKI